MLNDLPPSYDEVISSDEESLQNSGSSSEIDIEKEAPLVINKEINALKKKSNKKELDEWQNFINAILEMLGLADFKFEGNICIVDKKIAENILNEKNIDAVNNKEDKITALHSLISNGMTEEHTMKLIIALLDKGARTDIRANLDKVDEKGNSKRINCIDNKTAKEMVESLYKGYLVQKYFFDRDNCYIQNKNGLGDRIVEKVLGKELMNSIKDQYTTFIKENINIDCSARIKKESETNIFGAEAEVRNLIESNPVKAKFDLTATPGNEQSTKPRIRS